MTYQEIVDHLHGLANPEIAEHSQRFFKTAEGEYGFGDKFLGIRVPVIRQAVKKYKTAPLSVVEKLLKSEYHEIRLFALLLMVYRFSRFRGDEQEAISYLYLNNTRYINNWDLVDSSAHHILGPYLENGNISMLYTLANSNSLWDRRIAIISTFYFIKKNQFKETLRISERLLNDREDLIHKATGWMLREVGKRDLAAEVSFLNEHYQKMPRTMLRYAIEKFSKEERQKYLTGEK
ncbi:MAG: DNA alkylation repair protein [Gammaproteobacteria bacterium]|nr:DNA alkylation repair protein [Gammaproteobacteria bacterium]